MANGRYSRSWKFVGGVKILQGVLTESLFELAPNGMIKASSSRDFQTEDIQIENRFTIHQVSNLQPPELPTISLHVYAPPLARMNLYKLYDPSMISGWSEHYNFGAGI
jgi:cysteine dioxygenase